MTADRAHHRDVDSRFEDAGIPDLQDGTPEQQQAEDPQELPLPGDQPGASVDWGTTAEEQVEGEPLSLRLSREEPDAVLSDDDADVSVGRLVNEQDVVPGDDEVDTEAADVGKDWGGLTQEEQAMHIEPE
jgi:hypothetical protein